MNKKFILMLLCMLSVTVFLSATLYVDDDYTSSTPGWGTTAFDCIQDAIDIIASGGDILVYPGKYYETLTNYNGSTHIDVIIRSSYYTSGDWKIVEDTIIDAYGQFQSAVSFFGNGTTVDCELNGFTVINGDPGLNLHRTNADILNCIIEDNSNGNDGGGAYINYFSNVTIENCFFINNEAPNGGGIYSIRSTVSLTDCKFYANKATGGNGGAISSPWNLYNCGNLTISRCLFYENIADDYGGAIYFPGSLGTPDLIINFSTFADNIVTTGSGAKGIDLGSDGHDNSKDVLIENSIFAEAADNISTSTYNCDINYSCLKNGCDNSNADLSNCITTDPDFVSTGSDDYHILWDSPCIDSGDPNADEDDDYSIADMGVYPYERDHFNFFSRYTWLCYPRMDVPDDENNGEVDDYLLPDDCMDEFWSAVPNTVTVYNSDGIATVGTNNGGDLGWIPPTFQFKSQDGIKISSGYHFYIGGYLMDPGYNFDDLTADEENWLGYFLEESQHVEDAIPSAVMDDLLEIKTQTWSMIRASTAIEWQIDEDYTFNYGDLVILTPDNTVSNFKWDQSRDEVDPYYRPRAEYFEWEDEIDYLPIYVEFSPDNVPLEVAVYVNDVCKGAQVVDDTLSQICAYILEEEPGAEIEFAFYDGERNTIRNEFLVLDNLSGDVKDNKLVTGAPGTFYRVSFRENQEIPPAMKYNLHAEPNPFNPSTNICFELEEESNVSLNIYNCKGQKIRTLANETFRPGTYSLLWDGKNETGNITSSGVYFYKLECGSDVVSGKMIMLK